MGNVDDYQYPGQHVFEGTVYNFGQPPEVLKKIKEELQLDPSDIVIASYPKSGKLDLYHFPIIPFVEKLCLLTSKVRQLKIFKSINQSNNQ